jgi:hypothetical protein
MRLAELGIVDRRGETLAPVDDARLIMGQIEGEPMAPEPPPPVSQLGIDAGLLQIDPVQMQMHRDRMLYGFDPYRGGRY